jgi:hypothetical protein
MRAGVHLRLNSDKSTTFSPQNNECFGDSQNTRAVRTLLKEGETELAKAFVQTRPVANFPRPQLVQTGG